jgi:hypothetical protein
VEFRSITQQEKGELDTSCPLKFKASNKGKEERRKTELQPIGDIYQQNMAPYGHQRNPDEEPVGIGELATRARKRKATGYGAGDEINVEAEGSCRAG